jgi:hypothetical protein
LRVLAIVVPHFLLATRHLAGALDNGAGNLLVGDPDGVLLANFRQQQTKRTPFGDCPILLARLLLGGVLVSGRFCRSDRSIVAQIELNSSSTKVDVANCVASAGPWLTFDLHRLAHKIARDPILDRVFKLLQQPPDSDLANSSSMVTVTGASIVFIHIEFGVFAGKRSSDRWRGMSL